MPSQSAIKGIQDNGFGWKKRSICLPCRPLPLNPRSVDSLNAWLSYFEALKSKLNNSVHSQCFGRYTKEYLYDAEEEEEEYKEEESIVLFLSDAIKYLESDSYTNSEKDEVLDPLPEEIKEMLNLLYNFANYWRVWLVDPTPNEEEYKL